MAFTFKCDVCGVDGVVHHSAEMVKPRKKDDKVIYKKIRVQNSVSGVVSQADVPDYEYLFPKINLVRLSIGDETLQREICNDCLPRFRVRLEGVWTMLDEIGSK